MIPNIKHILYATDLSQGAYQALGYAVGLANICEASLTIIHVIQKTSPNAEPLIRKIQAASPAALVTDCLSCRLQIHHLLPDLPVFHPLQVLEQAYKNQS